MGESGNCDSCVLPNPLYKEFLSVDLFFWVRETSTQPSFILMSNLPYRIWVSRCQYPLERWRNCSEMLLIDISNIFFEDFFHLFKQTWCIFLMSLFSDPFTLIAFPFFRKLYEMCSTRLPLVSDFSCRLSGCILVCSDLKGQDKKVLRREYSDPSHEGTLQNRK